MANLFDDLLFVADEKRCLPFPLTFPRLISSPKGALVRRLWGEGMSILREGVELVKKGTGPTAKGVGIEAGRGTMIERRRENLRVEENRREERVSKRHRERRMETRLTRAEKNRTEDELRETTS